MKLLITILIIAFLGGLASYFTQWWWMIALAAFVVHLVAGMKPVLGFLSGFLGAGLLWTVWAIVADIVNEHILMPKMAGVFHLPNPALFVLVTALLGGIVGGMAGWSGSLLRKNLFYA
jgi:hypothetical protein